MFGKAKRLVAKAVRRHSPSVAGFLSDSSDSMMSQPEIGSVAGNSWDELRVAISREFAQSPGGFLRQPTIARTVHPNQMPLARAYLGDLSADEFSRTQILPRLHDVPLGDPYLCSFFPLASPMTIQHGYYLSLMKEHWNIFIPDNQIQHVFEIGGGYGNFCRLVFEYGYRGRYVIADLPEMHRIQKHFLGGVLPKSSVNGQIEYCPLNRTDGLPDAGPSLLIATFSISEMPLATRQLIEDRYEQFEYIFIAYNQAFDGVDNRAYFDSLAESLASKFSVQKIDDPHRGAWFLLCEKSDNR